VAVEGLLKLNKSLPDQTPRCKINQQDIFNLLRILTYLLKAFYVTPCLYLLEKLI